MGGAMKGFVEERTGIAKLLRKVVEGYLREARIPPVNDIYEYTFGKFAIGEFPSTREMLFYLGDVSAFTPELIHRLRYRVLSKFKKWAVVPQYHIEKCFISARGVAFGGGRMISAEVNEKTAGYRRWMNSILAEQEVWFGPLRRQFEIVKPLVSAALPLVRKNKVAVLAAFDRYVPPFWTGNPVVWVLTKGGRQEPEIAPGERRRTHAVTADGEIEPTYCEKYWPYTRVPSPFFLCVHEFPWRNRRKLGLRLPASTRMLRVKELIPGSNRKGTAG
jgi:hypothetical protein